MARALNPREIRTIKLGIVALVLMFVAGSGPKTWRTIQGLQTEVTLLEQRLADITGPKAVMQQAGFLKQVPAFAMPRDAEHQKYLFRETLAEQFKKAGLKEEPLQVEEAGSRKVGTFDRLLIRYRGKGKFDQILEALVVLKENPYYAGIEELSIKCDPKQEPEQRQEIEFEIVVSTLVK